MYTPNEKRYSKMSYNYCGESGLQLPSISLGLWQNFGIDADYDIMKSIILTAFDNGITHFDLANNYGPEPGRAEINFGKIFKENLKPYRDELIISTKAGYEMWAGPYGGCGGTRKYLMASLDQSLERLGLDYVDIFYHHRMTPNTPLSETALCMADIIRQGKSLYAGISNYDGETMNNINNYFEKYDVPFIINQNRYSIFDRTIEQNGLKTASNASNKGIIAFSPLAQGQLTNKYRDGIPVNSRFYNRDEYCEKIGLNQNRLKQIRFLCEFADDKQITLSQLAIKWLLKQGVTSVLIGVRTKAQLEENLKALNNASITDNDIDEIEKILCV